MTGTGERQVGRQGDVVLRDGATVHLRPVRPGDEPALLAFLEGLSDQSRWFRFFSLGSDLERMARESARADADHVGLVATAGRDGASVVGHGGYVRMGQDDAEVAFAVADDHQGRGLATILLGWLAASAEAQGIATLTASVLPENHRMIDVFRESGFPVRLRTRPGEISVELPSSPSAEARERFEQRERLAAAAAVRAVLEPRSVAIVGASRRPGSVGAAIWANVRRTGFTGALHAVNRHGGTLDGAPVHRSVRELEEPIDLAVVAVPAPAVIDVATDCAARGVRALVVVSAGFGETGPGGRQRQRELLRICRESGMRLVGPNCLGVLNTASTTRLNATFAPDEPPAGRVAILSQSGGVGIAVIEHARELGLGLSSFASVGNKADLSGNDFLEFWDGDPATDVVLLYLESLGNPRKFARIARRVARRKPVLAVRGGRTSAGSRAAGSHTGALLAASDVTVDGLFQQAGVVRADTLGELFDVAGLLATQPLPAGRSTAILTNAGGPAILCADACVSHGLELATLRDGTIARMRTHLPEAAVLTNPVDLLGTATVDDYRAALTALAADEGVDALVCLFVPALGASADEVARAISETAERFERDVPVLIVSMTAGDVRGKLHDAGRRIPASAFPEDAARALGRAAEYARWRAVAPGQSPPLPDIRPDEAAAIVATALHDGGGWLAPAQVAVLCGCYGIALADARPAADAAAAERAARALGGRLALKAVGPSIVHKSEIGGVRVGLSGPAAVRRAAEEMREDVRRAGHDGSSFLVQRMVEGGVEMIVGVVHDPSFGPVVACGAGGTTAELLRDVVARITPLTDRDAREMVRSLKTFPLLTGYRGAPHMDVAALEDVLLRVSALVEAHPEVAELDLNPVMVTPQGSVAVDARLRVASPHDDRDASLPGLAS